MSGIMCSSSQFEFEGWYFEFHRYCGPWPLKKNGDPRKRAGNKFYKMYDKFSKLSPKQQEKYMVYKGGCVSF